MKKLLAILLAALLVISSGALSWAEEVLTYDYDSLTVAVTTPMTGRFFTSMWGNNTSDTDVRALLHGYDLVYWDIEQGVFRMDETVVSAMVATQEGNNHTYTIVLHDDLTYSDGTPITAWDYAFSMLLSCADELSGLGANVNRPVWLLGFDAYQSGDAETLAGFRVLSDDQLAITISGEYLPFFYEIGLLSLVPYPASVIAPDVRIADDGNGIYIAEGAFTQEGLKASILDGYLSDPSVTSGPYTLVSYADGTAEFELNPLYKGDPKGNKPQIQHITFKSMTQDELIDALSSGEVQLINKATGADLIAQGIELIGEDDLFTFSSYARVGLSFISFNTEREAVSDVAVRQAMALAMDRDALTADVVSDYGIRADGYYGMGQWMVQVLNGTIAYPVEEPEDDSAQAQEEYQAKLDEWAELKLEDVEHYEYDQDKANALLDEAGWNLNAKGETFAAGTDDLRFRQTESGLEPLRLSLAYAQGSAAGKTLEEVLPAQLSEIGVEVSVTAIPLGELLPQYYHTEESNYDMFFLATNFDVLYEPSGLFFVDEDGQHVWRTSALADEELYERAVAMRRTEPGDLYDYCVNWLAFQKRFMEILPALPIYSNVYFDFYPNVLQDYEINANASWPQAVNGAFLGEYVPEETEEAEEDIFLP